MREWEELEDLKNQYTFVGLELTPNSVPLSEFSWETEKPPLILCGEEGRGLTFSALELCDHVVEIAMFGSVRSLNTATAGSIAMNDFVTKYLKRNS